MITQGKDRHKSVEYLESHKINSNLNRIGFISSIGGLLFGIDTGVINGSLSYMSAPSQLNLSSSEEGLVTSGITLGAAVGALIIGKLSDRYGRKKMLFWLSFVFFFCTLFCSIAPNAIFLIIFRFLLGLAVGGASVLVPTFLSEISPAETRGRMVTRNELMIVSGQLIAFIFNAILGASFDNVGHIWRYMLGFGMVPAAFLFLGMMAVPESPRWLIMHHRNDEALSVLRSVRDSDSKCQTEFREIETSIEKNNNIKKMSFKDLNIPWVRKLVLIGIGVGVMQQIIGINIMMYYGTSILMVAGFGHEAALVANIGNGVISVLATIVGMKLMIHNGRRKLLLSGITGTSISLILMSLVTKYMTGSSLMPYTVILLTMTFLGFFQGCISPIVWLLLSEIFPQELRGMAMGFATFFLWGSNFLVGYFFPILVDKLGISSTFAIFVICNIISFVFAYKFAPETMNKSLEEIQESFKNGKESK